MIIQCPNCDTRYRLDDARLGQDGTQVRCSRCSHVFFAAPPRSEDDAEVVQDSEFDWLKDMNVAGGSEPQETSEQNTVQDTGYETKDGNITLEIQSSEQPRTRAVTWAAVAIALISLALGALLYFPDARDYIRSWFTSAEPEMPIQEPEVLAGDQVSQISLQNVRQYFVSNEKIGQLFVVEGKARNDFPTAMELIKIEANLFDEQGEVVERKEFLAGNTVSLFQLQILSQEELEAALQAKVGILSNNTNLRPGMDVPFMVVFPNPPESVQEYGLKVIEAQHPPQ
ncbi:MAG TPA: DUF3426 domain-containing protein [Desulfonatronum sp.]|nr:DUF3426 domain-containing protein [Desulfonatronum sp.]